MKYGMLDWVLILGFIGSIAYCIIASEIDNQKRKK